MASALLYLALLASVTFANGHIRLPVTRTELSLLKRHHLHDKIPAKMAYYSTTIQLGEKKHKFRVVLDTGSSTLFVPAVGCETCGTHPEYLCKNISLQDTVSLQYGTGSAEGNLCTDIVTIGDYTVKRQTFGAMDYEDSFFKNFTSIDGILGLAYRNMNVYTNKESGIRTAPTIFENLAQQHKLRKIFSCYYTRNSKRNFIEFGGSDKNYYEGQLSYFPVQKSTILMYGYNFWQLEISSFTFGNSGLVQPTFGIIDTGTSGIAIPELASEIDLDSETKIPCEDIHQYPDIKVAFGDKMFSIEPSFYFEPQKDGLCKLLVFGSDDTYCIFGAPFFNKYFVEFDMENNRIGISPAKIPRSG